MLRRLALTAAAVATLATLSGSAGAGPRPRRWSRAARVDFPVTPAMSPEVRKLRAEGDEMLSRVGNPEFGRKIDAARFAASFYKAALAIDPRQPDLWFALGIARYYGEQWQESVDAFDALRALDPGYPRRDVGFFTAIALAKLSKDFERIVDEYQRWLREPEEMFAVPFSRQLGLAVSSRSQVHGNLAETFMSLGRLEEAIAHYREADALSPGQALNLYGLAVALDRDGNGHDAARVMRRALAIDPGMDELERPGVFFVPPGDVYYYFALGSEVKNNKAQAIKHWRSFLVFAPQSLYLARAREHLAALGATDK